MRNMNIHMYALNIVKYIIIFITPHLHSHISWFTIAISLHLEGVRVMWGDLNQIKMYACSTFYHTSASTSSSQQHSTPFHLIPFEGYREIYAHLCFCKGPESREGKKSARNKNKEQQKSSKQLD